MFQEGTIPINAIPISGKIKAIDLPREKRNPRIKEVHMPVSKFVANIADITHPGSGYQRPPHRRIKDLREIAASFNPSYLGVFHAWLNQEGEIEVMDGLGRAFVCLRLLNPPYDEPVSVHIHLDIHTEEEAARCFLDLNSEKVRKVTQASKFLSRVTEGEPEAVDIYNKAVEGGLIVTGTGVKGISVQAAEALYQLDILQEVGLVKANTNWREVRIGNPLFVALGAYLVATKDNSMELRKLLDSKTPDDVLYKMKLSFSDPSQHSRVTTSRLAVALVALRNEHKKVKVTPRWHIVNKLMSEFPDRWHAIPDSWGN